MEYQSVYDYCEESDAEYIEVQLEGEGLVAAGTPIQVMESDYADCEVTEVTGNPNYTILWARLPW